jgi:hypothetical protein
MVNFIPPNTDELRRLLERLYPNIAISGTGVALLAAQITDMESRYAVLHVRFNQLSIKTAGHKMAANRVLLQRKINRGNKYGTHNHAKQRTLPRAT